MIDAPLTGGFLPGGRIFAVDGDFSLMQPCGAPEIYNPFQGDSNPSGLPIVLMDRSFSPPDYVLVPFGSGFNVQGYAPNESAIVIEQEFMMAEAYYAALQLNTRYNPGWAVGWSGAVNLADCFLVDIGPKVAVGAGLVRFKLKFANLPPNRNERGSYCATFPAIDYGGITIRQSFAKIVDSRVFLEFFVFDENNLLGSIALFPAGKRLTSAVLASDGRFLNFEDFKVFAPDANAVANYQLLQPPGAITDGAGTEPTTPSYSTYATWQFVTEIVAEASSFERWMGNIFVRRTRFVVAL